VVKFLGRAVSFWEWWVPKRRGSQRRLSIGIVSHDCRALAQCMANTAYSDQTAPDDWPTYNPYVGPNSNDWIKGVGGACGASIPINTWGALW
jgi:hypothetical protein